MDDTASTAEAAASSRPGATPVAAVGQPAGTLGNRRVSERAEPKPGVPLQKIRNAGTPANQATAPTSLHSRQPTATTPAPQGIGSANTASRREQVGKPPPGSAPSTAAAADGATNAGREAEGAARLVAAPDVSQPVLLDSAGDSLFRGLQIGMLVEDAFSLPQLQQLSEHRLRSLYQCLVLNVRNVSAVASELELENLVRVMRDPNSLLRGPFARHLSTHASYQMAKAVAVEALAMNPKKRRQALAGQAVRLNLCAVSLLKPEENDASYPHVRGLNMLALKRPQDLRVVDENGVSREVDAAINVRHFALSTEGQSLKPVRSGDLHHFSAVDLVRLLGPFDSPGPTGEAGEYVDAATARALESIAPPLSKTMLQIRHAPGWSADRADLQQLRSRLVGARHAHVAELDACARTHRTLVEACRQLQTMWAERRDWPPGAGAHRRAAALLLLAAHHMGETPLLSCSDRNVAAQVYGEIDRLAAYAKGHKGHLPVFDSVAPAPPPAEPPPHDE